MKHQPVVEESENILSVTSKITSPMAALVLLVIGVAFAALTIATSISGALTNAVVSAAGFLAIIFILFMVKIVGKS